MSPDLYPIKFHLRDKRDEITTLIMRYNYTENGRYRSFKYYIGERVRSKQWDQDESRMRTKGIPRVEADHNRTVNDSIDRHRDALERVLGEIRQRSGDHRNLRKMLESILGKGVSSSGTFIEHFENTIRARERGEEMTRGGTRYKASAIASYRATLYWLEKYKAKYGEIYADEIDLGFYNQFVGLMNDQDKSVNLIGGRIKHIKMMLRKLYRDGISKNRIFEDPAFRKVQEISDEIYLSDSELDRIYEMNLTGYLDKARDLFLIGCYTGLRYSDYTHLRPENLVEGGKMLKKVTQKIGEPVYIPVHARVRAIMQKHCNVPPAKISNVKLNKYIKEVCKLAGINEKSTFRITRGGRVVEEVFEKWEKVTTHTARRSFATNLYLAGVEPLAIMPITGHASLESFLRYIRVSQEQHARKMGVHPWFGRE